ncbi:hypothetical protein [Pseudomarimonas arenosa]|uniref:Lipoprotein n=1 Tax=Pseudomarimonas arenosa TaxID=2774145 RepID=A0AAW3ZLI3_9GAMM|nr:hypothetical protein [Pseudomarimonas arenosa]MBD8526384.1 hypothetical protein [Pseudomarimonas arenosa]
MNHLTIRFLVSVASLALGGCATLTSGIEDGARPGGETAVVVGRFQVSRNDVELPASTAIASVAPTVFMHVSRFVDAAEVSKNPLAPGDFAVSASVGADGYFAVSLPPDRYYIVEFAFTNVLPGTVGYRSYMPILGGRVREPVILTFEAQSGRATYIGSIHHGFTETDGDAGKEFDLEMTLADETSAAMRWLAENHPMWRATATAKLVEPVRPN